MLSFHGFERKKWYRKFPKYSDTQKNCCNYPKFWTESFYYIVLGPKDTDRTANSVDPDQTASRSSLIWVCTVCLDLPVWKLRIITIISVVANVFCPVLVPCFFTLPNLFFCSRVRWWTQRTGSVGELKTDDIVWYLTVNTDVIYNWEMDFDFLLNLYYVNVLCYCHVCCMFLLVIYTVK